jgi:enoyl-[acyl-carrier protein] reductase I
MFSQVGKKALVAGIANEASIAYGASSGIGHFDEILDQAAEVAPTHHLARIDDVGTYPAFLASNEAANVTGGVHYIDGGYHIRA